MWVRRAERLTMEKCVVFLFFGVGRRCTFPQRYARANEGSEPRAVGVPWMMRIGGDRMWIDRGGPPDAANALPRRCSVDGIDGRWMMAISKLVFLCRTTALMVIATMTQQLATYKGFPSMMNLVMTIGLNFH